MITIKQTVFINASPKKVWKTFSNLDLWPKMNKYYVGARHLSGQRWAKSSRFEFTSDYGFMKTTGKVIILKSNPPNFIEWTGTKPFIKGKHSYAFRKAKKGTEVINYEEFTGVGLPIIYLLNLKPKIRDSFREFNNGLKREAERKRRI